MNIFYVYFSFIMHLLRSKKIKGTLVNILQEQDRTKEGNLLDLFRNTQLRRKTMIQVFTWYVMQQVGLMCEK